MTSAIAPILAFASFAQFARALRMTRLSGPPAPSYGPRPNQRQRRKYNRQRHANGIKNAFA
jgi:hypothetical protein